MGKTKYLSSINCSSRFSVLSKLKFGLQIVLLVLFSFLVFLLSPQKVQAAENIIFTEMMYYFQIPGGTHEWIELYNPTSTDVEITGWKFNDGSNHNLNIPEGESEIWISAGGYLVLASDIGTFLQDYPDFHGQVIDTVTGPLNNTSDTISIINSQGSQIDILSYDSLWGGAGNGRTLERVDFNVANTASNWQESYVLGGTPGEGPSEFVIPSYPEEVFELVDFEYAIIKSTKVLSIIDGDTIVVSGLTGFSSTIRLLAVDSAEAGESLFEPAKDFTTTLSGETIDLIISQAEDEQFDRYGRTLAVVIYENQVFNTQLLERGLASYYDTDNLILKNAAWQAIEEQAQSDKIGLWASTVLGSVILSELLPNPLGSDENEWIEIYNPLDTAVDLSYFLIDDYLIPYGTIIAKNSFMVFPRSQTGIALNNTGDSLRLFFPDGILADETAFGKANEGLSWALAGLWSWTTDLTPGTSNQIVSEEDSEEMADEEETDENIPINSAPVEIKTGEIQNYENYLVKITGTVVETSGNTFYLDDGSGKAKVYIQESSGIDKPPMRKGDIFEIIGIVDLYRGVWRVLPQKQDDIKLIKAISLAQDEEAKSSIAKATTAKSSTAKKSTAATTKARSPTVEGINSENSLETKVQAYQSSFWIQLTKAVSGLSIILLILLIVKIVQVKRENPWWQKPLGGDFGDDT